MQAGQQAVALGLQVGGELGEERVGQAEPDGDRRLERGTADVGEELLGRACRGDAAAGGAQIQPIFQPVVLNVLPPLEITSVRSRMPGSVASGTCSDVVEHEVLVDLVGDHDQVVLDRQVGDQLQLVDARAHGRWGCAGC